MQGIIIGTIDFAQVAFWGFVVFFAGLIFYLRREDKREGYPLESERSPYIRVQGFPWIPEPKTFLLAHGGTVSAPRDRIDTREIRAEPVSRAPGSPLEPLGDPLADGVGPAAYANRADVPELTIDGHPAIVPLRVADDHAVAQEDLAVDPRGMEVFGTDRGLAGVVRDLWVDRTEPQIRYLEIELVGSGRRLLPITLVKFDGRRRIHVKSLLAEQFAGVPPLKNPDQVTKLEEDRITAYYAGGNLYAVPGRLGPLL